ncbi:MAG: hypothetical protein K6F32_01810 [Bacilli bacterium]|nr:hypothetical protein [Bacilli bacterium]
MDIPRGDDALFRITLDQGYSIESVSYPSSSIVNDGNVALLTLEDVLYSTVVTIETKYVEVISSSSSSYSVMPSASNSEPEALHVDLESDWAQIRVHAPNGFEFFRVNGFLQTGWTTLPNREGDYVGFGWRVDKDVRRLYPLFESETSLDRFQFEENEDGYRVIGYSGDDERIVMPSAYQDKPITGVASGAIASDSLESLVLPPSMRRLQKNSIVCPNLKTLTFYDSLTTVFDKSIDCPSLQTIRLNAVLKPRFSGTYWDTFQNKVDFLWQNQGEKKLILFSGSSARYGYDSPTIEASFPDYRVVNMGVFAYSNAYPQLELISTYLNKGDVVFHTPELDAIPTQFFCDRYFDPRFWYMLESGYQELERLDIRRFGRVFSSFTAFQTTRSYMQERDYSIWAYLYDDEGVKYEFPIYNDNGDMTLYRPNTEGYVGPISQPVIDYRVEPLFGEYEGKVKAMDDLYHEYISKLGIKILFGHAPKNIYCLESSGTAEDRKEIDAYLAENITVPIIMDLESSLYDTTYFYKIDNHLSTEGVGIHTAKIISFLKAAGL